ncbi:MAG: ribosomal-protein-alanine N-acetyltransferase [Nitrospira sp.]|nr:ribosomal-protein-alanine N-acetyltransferase [Nitrospira sp.]
MIEVTIRQMYPTDIPEVVNIERTIFTTPWSETSFLQEINNLYSIKKVAVLNNTTIGYVCANHILNENHILNLAVHPEFRRCGIATKLTKEVLKELKEKGCDFVYLEVRGSNLSAKKFYEKLGFVIVAIRKDYYTLPREDAIIMALEM